MSRRWLAAILAASFGLRIWLAAQGGQLYWPDESRYFAAEAAAGDLSHGRLGEAAADLFGHADHVLFRPASLPAALVASWVGGSHPLLVSAYLSLFSVGTIFLIWAVARRAGAPEAEALWAAFLAACASSLLIYARFYLPYDIAMFELMGALWLALGRGSRANSLLVGATAGCGFLTYNGYWLLGAAILVLYTLLGDGGRGGARRRGLWAALGAAAVVALVLAIGATVSSGLAAAYGSFAGSVRQGDFRIGYRVIAQYLWGCEHALALVWLGAMAYAVSRAGRGWPGGRLGWWTGGLALVLGGLVLLSDVVPVFMVYGRLTRELVPFACLGAAQGAAQFLGARRSPGAWSAALALAVLLLAAANFAAPLRQVFPGEFIAMARGRLSREAGAGFGFYRVLFAENLWGRPLAVSLAPHEDVLRRANPLGYMPYQFEGYSAAQRAEFARRDISMRLVRFDGRIAASDREWGGFPGPVSMTVAFDPANAAGSEPIVACGTPSQADLIFVHYLDPGHLAFGLDHWGAPGVLSRPVEVDLGKPHSIIISAGCLLPPKGSAFYRLHPELEGLREHFVVIMDGRVVCSRKIECYPADRDKIFFGLNLFGGSTSRTTFTGTVSGFSRAPVGEIVGSLPSLAVEGVARSRPPEWEGAVGPLRLRFRLPPAGVESFRGQPVVAVAGPGSSGMLYVERLGDAEFRVGYDRRGYGLLLSKPFGYSPGDVVEMDVFIGSMLPAPDAAIYSRFPGFAAMRERILVRVNGEPALAGPDRFAPAGPRQISLAENTIACSVCGTHFQGDFESVRAIGPECIPPFGSRLVDLVQNADPAWGGYTGPLRLRVRFPGADAGRVEPLLVSGSEGASDALSVEYLGGPRVRFRFEHSGSAPAVSIPVEAREGADNDLLLSTGALMPAHVGGAGAEPADAARLRSAALVGLNGRPVLVAWQAAHPAAPAQIEIGAGSIRPWSAGGRFTGEVSSMGAARVQDPLELGAMDARLGRPGWDGYPGPVEMTVTVPADWGGSGEPLITTGYPGGGDFVFIERGAGDLARITQDHWGAPLRSSEPFRLAAGAGHRFAISFGALYPPQGAALYRERPDLLALRSKIIVSVDGVRVLAADQASHPTARERIIVGANLIGGSSAAAVFTGSIRDVALAPLESFRP